jgi:hypothetical protein
MENHIQIEQDDQVQQSMAGEGSVFCSFPRQRHTPHCVANFLLVKLFLASTSLMSFSCIRDLIWLKTWPECKLLISMVSCLPSAKTSCKEASSPGLLICRPRESAYVCARSLQLAAVHVACR